jgi:hypothetical protein
MADIEFKTTPEYDALPQVEKDATFYSDVYKDIHGIRPNLEHFRSLSDRDRTAMIDELLAEDVEDEDDDVGMARRAADLRNADHVDGYDRDDLGESNDY